MRTHLLVALGACLFTLVSAYGFQDFLDSGVSVVRADPTRIAAQIVTGIGFLGAGAIIREGFSVRGLTTAASLWIVAAIGMASGAGYYVPALAATALTVIALWPLRAITYRTLEYVRPESKRVIVELSAGQSIEPLLQQLGELRSLQVSDEADRRIVTAEVRGEFDETTIGRVSDLDFVRSVGWRR